MRVKTLTACILLYLSSYAYAEPVNVNLATSFEIASALQVSQKLAESISMHCQYVMCRDPEDLSHAPGMTTAILKRVEPDLIFSVMDSGLGYSDYC